MRWIILIIFIIMIDLILFLVPSIPLFLMTLVRSPHGSHDVVAQSHHWSQRSPTEVSQVVLTELAEKWKVERLLDILRQG